MSQLKLTLFRSEKYFIKFLSADLFAGSLYYFLHNFSGLPKTLILTLDSQKKMHIVRILFVSDHEYMMNSPENVILPIDFETRLTCQMNIEPDKFLWKFYPFSDKDMYNSKAVIDLNTAPYILINPDHVEDRKSFLNVKVQVSKKIFHSFD